MSTTFTTPTPAATPEHVEQGVIDTLNKGDALYLPGTTPYFAFADSVGVFRVAESDPLHGTVCDPLDRDGVLDAMHFLSPLSDWRLVNSKNRW